MDRDDNRRPPDNRPPEDYQEEIPKVPTPQTDRQRVISRSDRFWWFVYNDPKGRILLISAVIGTVYLIFRLFDAFALYNSIARLVDPSNVSRLFFMELPLAHYIALVIAVILNWVACAVKRPWCALLSTLAYFVAAVVYIRWALFIVPELVLMIISYMALVRRRGGWL